MQVQLEGGLDSQKYVKILLDGKSKGEVGLFILMHQLVHWSHEEHDLRRLIASGLSGIVKMK